MTESVRGLHHTTNWAEYDAALRARGSLLVCFFALVRFVKARRPVAAEIMHVPVGWGLPSTG